MVLEVASDKLFEFLAALGAEEAVRLGDTLNILDRWLSGDLDHARTLLCRDEVASVLAHQGPLSKERCVFLLFPL